MEKKIKILGLRTASLSLEAHNGRIFAHNTRPGSWVWKDESKSLYGKTIGGKGVYVDPREKVFVSDVNKKAVEQSWSIKPITEMTREEKDWRNIV